MKNLEDMTQRELKELIAKAKFLLETHKELSTDECKSDYALLHELLSTYFKLPPYFVFKRGKYFSKFIDAVTNVDQFLEKYFPGATEPQRIALKKKFIKCTIVYLEGIKLNVNLATFIYNYANIEKVVNKSFPGYLQAGMIKLLLR